MTPRARAATILLVEDEPLVRCALTRALDHEGFTVLAAEDGAAALALARSGAAIDLVVTDVTMPGVTGPELVERLVDAGVRSLVLYVSGYTEAELTARGILKPGREFMQKPFNEGDLTRRVHGLLGS